MHKLFPALAASLLFAAPAGAKTVEDFETTVETALADKVLPSIAVAVVDDTGVRWTAAYGLADPEQGIAATPDSVYRMASVSKTMIGAALAIALAEGRIDLDAPVSQYLGFPVAHPQFPETPITLEHLATHTSGILDAEAAYEEAYAFGKTQHPVGLEEWQRSYLIPDGSRYDEALNFGSKAPGEEYNYSNIAAALAALAVGKAMGIPFAEFTEQRIFAPLGMTSATWSQADVPRERFAAPSKLEDGRWVKYPDYALATFPDGGLRTSVNDLAKFLAAVIGKGQLGETQWLERPVIERMLQPIDLNQTENLPENHIQRGLFWSGGKALSIMQRRLLMGHNGGDPGVVTMMYFDPVTERGAIALTNADLEEREARIAFLRLYYALFELELPAAEGP